MIGGNGEWEEWGNKNSDYLLAHWWVYYITVRHKRK